MKAIFGFLIIALVAAGFLNPYAWVLAGIVAVAGIVLTGLGNAAHNITTALQTTSCPFCTSRIPVAAEKCKFCGEWVKPHV